MHFKDYFSTQSLDYAKYRPRYPAELFAYVSALPAQRARAWDCATGNGQAALSLTGFFEHVIATDGSQAQLDNAAPHERVTYRQATAEESRIESHSIDLVTVAQALHWFDLERFYAEVRRVLKPAGALAAWCYDLLEISPALDAVINRFYSETVGPYWPLERRIIEDKYRSLAFPFDEVTTPPFDITAQWNLLDLLGYFSTWSATQRFIAARGHDPVPDLADELLPLWGEPHAARDVRWPLFMRAGVVRVS
jgi:SAM-dependent methyltransferase